MSGIFGLLFFDEQPVSPDTLNQMRESMAYWGSDDSKLWYQTHVGLGHLLSYNTPESVYESLPRQGKNGLVITANARIDNREELCRLFNIPPSKRPTTPDSDLILRAYEQWGKNCVDYLIGDWSFALWNPQQRQLWIARDCCGTGGLYYVRHPRFLAFSSCLKGLLALPEVPKQPNLLQVTRTLTTFAGNGSETAYQDIFHLPPAHTITVSGDRVEISRYWDLENISPIHLHSDEEYVEAFLALYSEAVSCRMRSYRPVGATLSGGLDSSSVCALAARQLRTQEKVLPVYSAVPRYETETVTNRNRFGDESPYIEANRQWIDNLDVYYLRSERISPLAGIKKSLWLHDRPGHAALNAFWIVDLLQTAREQHLGTLLTGQCGNYTVSWNGNTENWWRSLLQGKWQTLIDRASQTELSPWEAIKRYLLRPLAMPTLEQFRRLQSVGNDPWESYSAINPELARSLALGQKMREENHDPTFSNNSTLTRLQIFLITTRQIGTIWQENGAGYNLEIRDPTIDKRLTEFCFAIPDEQYERNGQNRWLIRRAMQELLPDKVRLNQRKGLQAADIGYRLLNSFSEVRQTLERLQKSELATQVLDLAKMERVLLSLENRVTRKNSIQCSTILMRGLMSGLFLLRFENSNTDLT